MSIRYKTKTIAFAILAFIAASLTFGETAANNSSPSEDREAILDMIAQINHINWILCTIKSYNNIVVLEEEYEKISPGNLYLDRIPDEETLGRITKMLDTLYSLRKGETGGFRVERLDFDPPVSERFYKQGKRGTLSRVEFRGVLSPTDFELFEATWKNGIGSAKGLGFGLLLLKPIA
jgi:hypothetical protein